MDCSRLYRLHCPQRSLLLQVAGEGGAKEPSLCSISYHEEIEEVCSLHHDKAEHPGEYNGVGSSALHIFIIVRWECRSDAAEALEWRAGACR